MDVITLLQEFGPEVVLLVVGACAYHRIIQRLNDGRVTFQEIKDKVEGLHEDHKALEKRLEKLEEGVDDIKEKVYRMEGASK